MLTCTKYPSLNLRLRYKIRWLFRRCIVYCWLIACSMHDFLKYSFYHLYIFIYYFCPYLFLFLKIFSILLDCIFLNYTITSKTHLILLLCAFLKFTNDEDTFFWGSDFKKRTRELGWLTGENGSDFEKELKSCWILCKYVIYKVF